MNDQKLTEETRVYLPGLPDLNSSDTERAIWKHTHKARGNLLEQMCEPPAPYKHPMFIPNIDGYNPWLRDILPIVKDSGAFVFPPMTTLPENHPQFQEEVAKRWFELTSMITGAHVGNEEQFKNGISKPNILADPDGHYAKLLEVYKDLHRQGMFSSDINQIVQTTDTSEQVRDDYKKIQQDFYGNSGAITDLANRKAWAAKIDATNAAINTSIIDKLQEALDKKIGKPYKASKAAAGVFDGQQYKSYRKDQHTARHPFGVLFFGSATTDNKQYMAASSDLAKEVGARGWRMITGVGTKGCMGAFDAGFSEGKKEFAVKFPRAKYRPAHIGVSTEIIMGFEGGPQGGPPGLDHLILVNDIYDRMRVMIKGKDSKNKDERLGNTSQVIVVAPGGTGTMQEFSAMMQLFTNGEMMQGRKVVLLNIDHCWDKLIEVATEYHFDHYFEEAKSVEQAIKIADEHYKTWQANLTDRAAEKYSNLPHPKGMPYYNKSEPSPVRMLRGRRPHDTPDTQDGATAPPF